MAGYMLLYLACLRALTVCLATVSSSRLLFKMIMIILIIVILMINFEHSGTVQLLGLAFSSFAPQSSQDISSIRWV